MSQKTSNLGPRVSMSTTPAQPDSVMLFEFPSGTTVDASAARVKSRITTASLDSTSLLDGEVIAFQLTASAGTMFVRSGVTTYQFSAATATVL